jgi:hypothetical protein
VAVVLNPGTAGATACFVNWTTVTSAASTAGELRRHPFLAHAPTQPAAPYRALRHACTRTVVCGAPHVVHVGREVEWMGRKTSWTSARRGAMGKKSKSKKTKGSRAPAAPPMHTIHNFVTDAGPVREGRIPPQQGANSFPAVPLGCVTGLPTKLCARSIIVGTRGPKP